MEKKINFFSNLILKKSYRKFYSLGDNLSNFGAQLMFESLIAEPLMEGDWRRNPVSQNPAQKPGHDLRRNARISSILYHVLDAFYQKANGEVFKDYNHFSYQDFISLLHANNFIEQLRESGRDSAFAMYLLGHTDPRIDFLSLHFIARNPATIAELYQRFGEKIYEQTSKKGNVKTPEKIMQMGNTILSMMELDASKDFQPEGETLSSVLYKGARALSAMYAEVLRNEQEYQHRISGLEQEIRDEKRKTADIHGEKDALLEEIRLMTSQIHELQSREPHFDPDEKYLELQEAYRDLERKQRGLREENSRLSDTITRNREQMTGLRQNNLKYQGVIDEKQKKIASLEREISELQHRFEELQIKPAIQEFYSEQAILMIAGIDKAAQTYESILSRVFGYVDVVHHDKMKTQRLNDYDMIIIGTGHTSHSDREWLQKRHNNVIVYPHGPNTILKFLYDQLPKGIKAKKR